MPKQLLATGVGIQSIEARPKCCIRFNLISIEADNYIDSQPMHLLHEFASLTNIVLGSVAKHQIECKICYDWHHKICIDR